MKLFSFKGGTHPPDNKARTEKMAIEEFATPKKLYLPLLQHIGAPLQPLVKVGDKVLVGQKIADSQAFVSAPIHSPVSGKVLEIAVYPFPVNGKIQTILIENDQEDKWVELTKSENYKDLPQKEILEIIKERGIVGMGGAAFPTHIKLDPPRDKKIDTLLINAAECEPYLNADNRVMLEETQKLLDGIEIIMYVLGVKKAFIGIEINKPEAMTKLRNSVKNRKGIEVASLKTKYPQGGEKQLIKAILNREVPSKCLPSEVGVVVQNVGTAVAVYDGVIEGKPVIDRVMTISGNGIGSPKNLRVKIGTKFKHVLKYCNLDEAITKKIVMGGPMMGLAQYTIEVPIVKGTSGILALDDVELNHYKPKSCISCGKCIDACPMNLMPLMFAKLSRFNEWKELNKYNLMDCIECGSCAYSCPANRPLTESIKIGKSKLRTSKK